VHEGKDLLIGPVVVTAAEHDVVITYAGKPRTVKAPTTRSDTTGLGWHTTGKGQVWTMQKPYGAYTWYPVNDHPSDKAQYTVRLNVPDKWVGVSNGAMSSKVTLAGRTITEFTSNQPMASYLVTVAIGPYAKYSQTGPRGIPITYWYPKGKTDLLAPLKHTPKTLAWLESKLGPYPFPRAGVVITPGKSSVETQTMITMSKADYKYGPKDVRQQIAHNLVHHWYGNSVTPNDWRDLWMSEGMATYLEAKYTVARGWDTWQFWKREFARNDAYYRELYGGPGSFHTNDFGQRNAHYGSALMLHKLRATIGAKTFDAAIREWPQQNANSTKGRSAYISFMEAKSGKDLGGFFNSWLNSDTTP
jgi:aminopeptidase N